MASGKASVYAKKLSRYARNYVFIPRYLPDQTLSLTTADGVRLAGARLDGPPDAFAAVVLVHGLVHSSRTPGIHAFAHLLARSVHVLVPELRGHGRSEGVCTLGVDEPLDVAAAVAAAEQQWPGLPVVTMGTSLGGAAVLLHAGAYGGVAGVVAISAPAWWSAGETASTRRVQRAADTPVGRMVMARLLRTRMAVQCDRVPDARDLVAKISPAFLLIVHDPADHYFGRVHAETLYEWAGEPKALWFDEGRGHGTDLLTPSLADRLVAELRARLT